MADQKKCIVAVDPTVTVHAVKNISSDDFFKIGGTTIGTISIGGAIGGIFGPPGAVAGAVIGGIAGAAISTRDAMSHRG